MTGLVENRSDAVVTHIYEWLCKIKADSYAEVHRIYHLQQTTPEFWINCKVFFDKPILPEHKSMVAAGQKVREEWRTFKSFIQLVLKKEREANAAKNNTGEEGTGSEDKGGFDRVPATERMDS